MRIQSEDGSRFIQMTLQEVGPPCYPSVSVQIEACANGFSATVNEVWLEADTMRVFLTELERLECHRSGTTSLASMGPGEADLSLQTIDRAGHMIARLDLSRHIFIDRQDAKQSLSITFEIDVSLLPRMIRQFKQLIPVQGSKEQEKRQ